MITYRVQVAIPREVYNSWLDYMLQRHIPDVLATGCFTGYSMSRILDSDPNVITVAICYCCASVESYERYRTDFAPALQSHHTDRYGALVSASRMLLTDDLHVAQTPSTA
jgi:Domain of unknown function (DUF4286)